MNEHDNRHSQNQAFEPNRRRLVIDVGMLVETGNSVYRVVQLLDFESVIGIDVETGRSRPLRIGELRALAGDTQALPPPATQEDLDEIADADWRIAQQRYAAIKPLIGKYVVGRDEAERRAKEVNVNAATLYRWLQRFNSCGTVTALIPLKRGWKEGNNRISPEAETIIEKTIKEYYLTDGRPTGQKTVTEVERRCSEAGIDAPSHMTIRARIAKISEKEKLRGRGFKEKAKNKFQPTPGSFPNADYPLSVVQIDHTPVDIILVDDEFRKPIGRPWITLAIDVCCRTVTGYYLSFDPPSLTSVAMCVAHSILPKEDWLLLHNIDSQWPIWGFPRTIHVDNGADFRSKDFRKSCSANQIDLEFRPVKVPRYGGHIERLLGTLLTEIHDLPGTTFSSVKDREGYDSEKHAAMTKSEFEEWLVGHICKVYHQRLHKQIGMSPLRKWEIGIFGNGEIHGIGLPPRPTDRLTILLDFLPSFRRTVQTFGVTIDKMTYYAEALRPWINIVDEDTGKVRKLLFRRDPRDISCIWFFDPTLKQYFKIPFADQSLPSMSIWELQQAKAKLKREGVDHIDEFQILKAITELRNHVEESKEKTKKARRQAQRRKEHEKKTSPAAPLPAVEVPPLENDYTGLLDEDIDDFGDIS